MERTEKLLQYHDCQGIRYLRSCMFLVFTVTWSLIILFYMSGACRTIVFHVCLGFERF